MSIVGKAKRVLRPLRNVLWALFGFGYGFLSSVRYGAWREHGDGRKPDYKAVKTYHCLEKSLAFRQRRSGSGWDAAGDLTHLFSRGGTTQLHGVPGDGRRGCCGVLSLAPTEVARSLIVANGGAGCSGAYFRCVRQLKACQEYENDGSNWTR